MGPTNDVVYLLGKRSAWDDNELRYSLRSVERHLKNIGTVYIIGGDPSFLNPETFIHIPYADIHKNKARNIKDKIYSICQLDAVSDNFMLFNDDYFLNQDIDATNYPYYHKCKLQETMLIQRNEYSRHVSPTFDILRSQGFRTWNYDVHKPIIYNKRLFMETMDKYDWEREYGFIIRSLYCNTLKVDGAYKKDGKAGWAMPVERWVRFTEEIDCFSIDDCSVNEHFKTFIDKLFPTKSRFEL